MAFPLPLLLLFGLGAAVAITRKKPAVPPLLGPPIPPAPPPAPPPAAPPAPPAVTVSEPIAKRAQEILTEYALDPGMPADLRAGVAAVLAKETDPNKLDKWATDVENLGFQTTATALRAKAASLRALGGASEVLQRIDKVIKDVPDTTPAPTTTEVRDKARETVEKAADLAKEVPDATELVSKAAQAAASAAKAAVTLDPVDVAKASAEAAEAARAVLSPIGESKAAEAATAAQEAIAEPTPDNIKKAAAKAVETADQVVKDVIDLSKMPVGIPEGVPLAPLEQVAPGVPVEQTPAHKAIVALATAATAEIRAKGCWREDRAIITAFQQAVAPSAGKPDGFYGPKTALTAAMYVPKVPAPCYWPSASTARAAAKDSWKKLVAEGAVTIGRLNLGA